MLLIFLPAKRDHLQELRGGRLDRERREMSEKRESANAARDQALPRLAGDSAVLSGGAEARPYHHMSTLESLS